MTRTVCTETNIHQAQSRLNRSRALLGWQLYRSPRPVPRLYVSGKYSQCEIENGQQQKALPITRHIPNPGTQLIAANKTMNRKIGRKDTTNGLHRLPNGFARPSKPGQEKLGNAGPKKD